MKKISTDKLLVLDTVKLWEGIKYYLHQRSLWNHVDRFTPDSLFRLRDRLQSEQPEAIMPRVVWQNLTDAQRLETILNVTKTLPIYLPNSRVVELLSFSDVRRRAKNKAKEES